MERRRVAITGIGVVAPNAIGKEDFWEALAMGKSGIGRITKFNPSEFGIETQIAGEVQNFDPGFIRPVYRKVVSFGAQFAIAATKMALLDAQLKLGGIREEAIGVMMGCSSSPTDSIEAHHGIFENKERINPLAILSIVPSSAGNYIGKEFNCKGPVITFSTGYTSGTDAIGSAFQAISLGQGKIFIAGGAESQITPFGMALLQAAHMLSERNDDPEGASRPFDKGRDGMVLGEGAGILILEELEHALERGAHIYAEIIGYENRTDGGDVGSGLERAMSAALLNANIASDEVGHISAHAASDSFDKKEARAIKKVFGKRAREIPVSSIKSMIGHTLSAAGPLQTIASIIVFERGIIPPTINLEHPIDCDLDFVPNKARMAENISTILINSHDMSGANSCLVVRKY